jgi:hypothetical protein
MIYFCHIPKTSGSSISAAVSDHTDHLVYFGDMSEAEAMGEDAFISFLRKRNNDDFIKGHFATTPIEIFPGIKSYSIIRDPIERLLSCFRYSQQVVSWEKPFKDVLYEYCTYSKPLQSSMGFDGRPNIQSDYLTQPLEWISSKGSTVSVKKGNLSFNDLLKEIKKNNFTLSTLDNREYLLKDISLELTKSTRKEIHLNKKIKINDNPFKLNDIDIFNNIYDEIYQLNKLDFDLYHYIHAHETLTGRALRPSDIDI